MDKTILHIRILYAKIAKRVIIHIRRMPSNPMVPIRRIIVFCVNNDYTMIPTAVVSPIILDYITNISLIYRYFTSFWSGRPYSIISNKVIKKTDLGPSSLIIKNAVVIPTISVISNHLCSTPFIDSL